MIIYIGSIKPFEVAFNNTLEKINEFLHLILIYHLLCFCDFYGNIEIRYSVIGVSCIITTALNLSFNAWIVFLEQRRIYRA